MPRTDMDHPLTIYNTMSRSKERFEPLNPPFVGLYACGPTVYGDAHLGHARQAVTFDILYRYLEHLGYRVRYVRNITDVGHLENDADEGEDKIAKKARLTNTEPMEVVQHYMNAYHRNMDQLNVRRPSIEPRASGHIIEQTQLVQQIMDAGLAYEVNGSVYFDVEKYSHTHHYGKLSGRRIEDLISNTRELEGQREKRNPLDFALWKKAEPNHIMRWPSPWGEGFPGWHLECSVMSTRYLGEKFDIHGGGLDLLFPHHECEIAQNVASHGEESVRYWMHNNMITINGKKMGRSLGNFITLDQVFSGDHDLLEHASDPMAIRFFILQAHYRSTLDFSNEALRASEKGLKKLFAAMDQLNTLKPSGNGSVSVQPLKDTCAEIMNDDLNTPVLIAHLFDIAKTVQQIKLGNESIDAPNLAVLKEVFAGYVVDVLGLEPPREQQGDLELTSNLLDTILQIRLEAKKRKDFETADRIRDALNALGIEIKDRKDGFDWEIR